MNAVDLKLTLIDSRGQTLDIQVGDVVESDDVLDVFDCVAMSARYDNGFGFSQLYRFADDKESQEIKKFCELVKENNRSQLLPMRSSGRWWVIATPIVKGNGSNQKLICESIMSDIFHLSQAPRVESTKLLISQYSRMYGYRDQQFEGVFEALRKIQAKSFSNLGLIYFEVDKNYREKFNNQIREILKKPDGC